MPIMDEYLIKLGGVVDTSTISRLSDALRSVVSSVDQGMSSMAKSILKFEAEAVTAFAGVGAAAIAMAGQVASADQEYRLFGLTMYMNADAAKKLKITLDALGQPIGMIAWDKELSDRADRLEKLQDTMEGGLNAANFEENMMKARELRFQVTQMEVSLEYLKQSVINGLLNAFGPQIDVWIDKLQQFNTWFADHLPEITEMINKYLVPILKDVGMILKDTLIVGRDFAELFTNIVGVLSGNDALSGAVTFEKFASAVQKVVHLLAMVLHYLLKITGTLAGIVVGGGVGSAIGSVIGAMLGIPAGPAGMLAGFLTGGAVGGAIGSGVGGVAGGIFDLHRASKNEPLSSNATFSSGSKASSAFISDEALTAIADKYGVPAELVKSVIHTESRGNPNAVSPVGARGLMQLMPGTAADMGVENAFDPNQNVEGGTRYLSQLLREFNGDTTNALMAYNWGPEKMRRALKSGSAPPASVQNYARQIEHNAGTTIGSVNVHINQPNASPQEVQARVSAGVLDGLRTATQRNLLEFQGAFA